MADKTDEAALRQRICEAIRARHEIDFKQDDQVAALCADPVRSIDGPGQDHAQGKWHDFEPDQISDLTRASQTFKPDSEFDRSKLGEHEVICSVLD